MITVIIEEPEGIASFKPGDAINLEISNKSGSLVRSWGMSVTHATTENGRHFITLESGFSGSSSSPVIPARRPPLKPASLLKAAVHRPIGDPSAPEEVGMKVLEVVKVLRESAGLAPEAIGGVVTKRKPGRPKGSKNKPKAPTAEVVEVKEEPLMSDEMSTKMMTDFFT